MSHCLIQSLRLMEVLELLQPQNSMKCSLAVKVWRFVDVSGSDCVLNFRMFNNLGVTPSPIFWVFNTMGVTASPSSWCSTLRECFRPHLHGVQHHGSVSVLIFRVLNAMGVIPSPSSRCSIPWEWRRPHLHNIQHPGSDSVSIFMVFTTMGVTPSPSS